MIRDRWLAGAVTLATTGTASGRMVTLASASAIASAAGCIRGQWNGADTDSGMARLTPLALAIRRRAPAPPWCRRSPPGPAHCHWRRRRRRRLGRFLRHALRRCSMSAPISAAMRALAHRHRRLHRLAAHLQQPRRVGKAESARGAERGIFAQPVAGDQTGMAGDDPARISFSSTRMTASDSAMIAGWAFSVRVRSVFRAFPHQPRQFLRQRVVDFLEHFARGRESSARSLPMPTAWLPCPGKRNARVIAGRDKSRGLARVKVGEKGPPNQDHGHAARAPAWPRQSARPSA